MSFSLALLVKEFLVVFEFKEDIRNHADEMRKYTRLFLRMNISMLYVISLIDDATFALMSRVYLINLCSICI